MAEKINLYNIKQHLNSLSDQLHEIRPHRWYVPEHYIQNPDQGEKIYKFNGVYYRSKEIKTLLDALRLYYQNAAQNETTKLIPKTTAGLSSILTDFSRIKEQFALQIQHEYIKLIPAIDTYICTDGNLLFKTTLTPMSVSSKISVKTVKGKKAHRGWIVFKYFVDENITYTPFFFDGNLGNCRIDNLSLHQKDDMNYDEV